MADKEPATQAEHVKTKGKKCPVGCLECGASWMDEYSLVGYVELE